MLAKRSGTSPFSDYLGFQSNAKCMDEHVEKDDRDDEGFERMSIPAAWSKSSKFLFWFLDPLPDRACAYFKLACQTRTYQSLSKLRQFRNRQAEIQDTQLGLTGMAKWQKGSVQEELGSCWFSLIRLIR